MHAAATSSTPAGGFPSDLSSPRSFLFKESSAAAALTSAGSAASRSFSMFAFISITSASFVVACAAISFAVSASLFAFAFSASSFGIIASHCAGEMPV